MNKIVIKELLFQRRPFRCVSKMPKFITFGSARNKRKARESPNGGSDAASSFEYRPPSWLPHIRYLTLFKLTCSE